MLGIDIYDRYQDWDDPQATEYAGVKYLWVKGTDGMGKAKVLADEFVKKAKDVEIRAGLYHYAQFGDARKQADVLVREVHRLGALGVMPCLDLEDPFPAERSSQGFAVTFLRRLKEHGFDRPVLYANTSMLKAIDSNDIRRQVPGTVIWCANYGPNNGQRNVEQFVRATAGLHVDVWQYTSAGSVAGIPGSVDKNWAFNQAHLTEGNDVALDQSDIKAIAVASAEAVWETHRAHLDPDNSLILPMWIWTVGGNMGAWAAANRPIPVVDIDEETLAEHLAAQMLEPLQTTLREEDGFNEEDAETLVTAFARRLAGMQIQQMRSVQAAE